MSAPRPRRADDGFESPLRGVAFLACGFDFSGGMEGQARRLAEGLAARGVPVIYVTTSPSRDRRPLHEERGLLEVFRVPVLATVDWATSLGILEVTALGLLARRRQALDGIYAVHFETGAIAQRVGQALGLPVVVKLAGSGTFGDVQGVLHSPDRGRLIEALRSADRVAASTPEIAREAEELLGIAPERIVRLATGVDLERFRPHAPARPVPGGAPARVLFMGRLAPQKRIDVLLAAAAALVKRRPELGLELVIAGDGPLEAALRVRCEELGLRRRARFLGRLGDVRSLLAEATLLALPSEAEGTSNALLEAMAAALPVVTTRVPGIEELVRHEVEGLLVEVGDAAGLEAALERLLDDPALAHRLGRAGRRRVEELHAMSAVIEEHLALFRSLREAPHPVQPGAPDGAAVRILRATTRAGFRTSADGVRSTARLVADQVRRRRGGPDEAGGVAFLLRDLDGGGRMAHQARVLARGLAARGVPVTLITSLGAGLLGRAAPNGWREVRDGLEAGIEVLRLPLLAYESVAAGYLFKRPERVAVLYALQLEMVVVGARLARLLNAPLVVKLGAGGPFGDIAALQSLEPEMRGPVRDALRQAYLVCQSEEIAHEARAAGLEPSHLVRIPNGVDVGAIAAAAPIRPVGEDPTVLFTGSHEPAKGVDLLLHAFAQAAEQVPFVRLLLAGTGPQEADLRALARRLKVADRVHFLGVRDDTWGLLRGATLFALPSRSEGMSDALLEALAAGTPVVASAIRPNVEVLGDGTGLLVHPDDVDAFAHALVHLLERPEERARLATLGQARVRELFTVERFVDDFAALFARLAGGAEPPTRLGFARRFLGDRARDLGRVARALWG